MEIDRQSGAISSGAPEQAQNLAVLVPQAIDPWGVMTVPVELLAEQANCEPCSVVVYLRQHLVKTRAGLWLTQEAKDAGITRPYPFSKKQIKEAQRRTGETLRYVAPKKTR